MANTKRNTVREDKETAPTTKRKRKEAPAGDGRWARFKAFLANERTHKVGGLFLVLASDTLIHYRVRFVTAISGEARNA